MFLGQVQQIGSALLNAMLGRCQLCQQLKAFHDLYLGGAPTLTAFSHYLIDRLLEGETLVEISDADLQDTLALCLSSASQQTALPVANLTGKPSF